MTPARAYRLAGLILSVAGALILAVGVALLARPDLAPAGRGANAQGVQIVGGVLVLAAVVKLAIVLALRRLR